MKQTCLLLLLLSLFSFKVQAQDTLYTQSSQLIGTVTKISADSVFFTLSGTQNPIAFHKNNLSSIRYKSGLLQEFAGQASVHETTEQDSAQVAEANIAQAEQDGKNAALASKRPFFASLLFIGYTIGVIVLAVGIWNLAEYGLILVGVLSVLTLCILAGLKRVFKPEDFKKFANPIKIDNNAQYSQHYNETTRKELKKQTSRGFWLTLLFGTMGLPLMLCMLIITLHNRGKALKAIRKMQETALKEAKAKQ